MNWKDADRLKKEFWEIHPKLRLILVDLENWSKARGEETTITCLLRTPEEQSELFDAHQAPARTSVHEFGRGADVRLFQTPALNLVVGDYINEKYGPYDHERPELKVLITHEGNAMHHHIQVLE